MAGYGIRFGAATAAAAQVRAVMASLPVRYAPIPGDIGFADDPAAVAALVEAGARIILLDRWNTPALSGAMALCVAHKVALVPVPRFCLRVLHGLGADLWQPGPVSLLTMMGQSAPQKLRNLLFEQLFLAGWLAGGPVEGRMLHRTHHQYVAGAVLPCGQIAHLSGISTQAGRHHLAVDAVRVDQRLEIMADAGPMAQAAHIAVASQSGTVHPVTAYQNDLRLLLAQIADHLENRPAPLLTALVAAGPLLAQTAILLPD